MLESERVRGRRLIDLSSPFRQRSGLSYTSGSQIGLHICVVFRIDIGRNTFRYFSCLRFSFSETVHAWMAWHGMVRGRIEILSGFYDEDTLGLLVICAWDGEFQT